MSPHEVYYQNYVRPAFDLNESAVLFVTPADGGKAAQGALGAVGPNMTDEWKLTLLDDGTVQGLSGHAGFAVDSVEISGSMVEARYSGAATGADECISAVALDGSGNAILYGRLKSLPDASDAEGTEQFDMAGLDMTGLTLYLYKLRVVD